MTSELRSWIEAPPWRHAVTAIGSRNARRYHASMGASEFAPVAFESAVRLVAAGEMDPGERSRCRIRADDQVPADAEACVSQARLEIETESRRRLDAGQFDPRLAASVRGRLHRLALVQSGQVETGDRTTVCVHAVPGAGRDDGDRTTVCVHAVPGAGRDDGDREPEWWALPPLRRGTGGRAEGRFRPDPGAREVAGALDGEMRVVLTAAVEESLLEILAGWRDEATSVERGAFLLGPLPELRQSDPLSITVQVDEVSLAPSDRATAVELLTSGNSWLTVARRRRAGRELAGFCHTHPFENGQGQSLVDQEAQVAHLGYPHLVSGILAPDREGRPRLHLWTVRGGTPVRLRGYFVCDD